jgi:hypothetical protein
MVGRVFGEELSGDAWDAVRAIRERIVGNRGAVLDADIIPTEFHDLLSFASLLSTGEGPLAEDFWNALSPGARATFMLRMSDVRADKMQEWARQAPRGAERSAIFRLAEVYKVFRRLESGERYGR